MKNRKLIFLLILLQLVPLNIHINAAENEQGELSINQTDGPSARGAHTMAYDSFNHKTILFGGVSVDNGWNSLRDTWAFDYENKTWIAIEPTTRPSAKSDAAMVYDSANQRIILFGGVSDDTWSFNYQTGEWTEISTDIQSPARRSHSMVYDSTDSKIFMFGGFVGDYSSNDFWVFDCDTDTWSELNPAIKPPVRYGQVMTYDSSNHKVILFGGNSPVGFKSDTWIYDCASNIWTQQSLSYHPSGRKWAFMTYDSTNQKSILFGGDSGPALSDTWAYDYESNQWEQLTPSESPSARIGCKMVYDTENDKMIMFAGFNGAYETLDDTWIFDYSDNSWEELSTTSGAYTPTDTVREYSVGVMMYSLILVGIPLFYLRKRNKKYHT